MNKTQEALKLALEALEESLGYVEEEAENAQRLYGQYPTRQARIQGLKDDASKHMNAITAIREALAHAPTEREQPAQQYNATSDHRLMENAQGDLECINLVQTGVGIGKPEHEPVAYSYTSRITGAQGFSHHPMPRFIDAESWDIKPLYTAKHPIIPAGWKLVPVEPTPEMLKAMDECSTEGYDERLLAGHAWSVYTAAIDATPEAIAPPRKPMTVEQLFEHWRVAKVLDMTDSEIDFSDYVLIARDVEALYGIK